MFSLKFVPSSLLSSSSPLLSSPLLSSPLLFSPLLSSSLLFSSLLSSPLLFSSLLSSSLLSSSLPSCSVLFSSLQEILTNLSPLRMNTLIHINLSHGLSAHWWFIMVFVTINSWGQIYNFSSGKYRKLSGEKTVAVNRRVWHMTNINERVLFWLETIVLNGVNCVTFLFQTLSLTLNDEMRQTSSYVWKLLQTDATCCACVQLYLCLNELDPFMSWIWFTRGWRECKEFTHSQNKCVIKL